MTRRSSKNENGWCGEPRAGDSLRQNNAVPSIETYTGAHRKITKLELSVPKCFAIPGLLLKLTRMRCLGRSAATF
jgi:hypothetical protein